MSSTDDLPIRTGSFLLRIRQARPGELRGQIEHIQSGDIRSFRGMDDVSKFIEAHLESLLASTVRSDTSRSV